MHLGVHILYYSVIGPGKGGVFTSGRCTRPYWKWFIQTLLFRWPTSTPSGFSAHKRRQSPPLPIPTLKIVVIMEDYCLYNNKTLQPVVIRTYPLGFPSSSFTMRRLRIGPYCSNSLRSCTPMRKPQRKRRRVRIGLWGNTIQTNIPPTMDNSRDTKYYYRIQKLRYVHWCRLRRCNISTNEFI